MSLQDQKKADITADFNQAVKDAGGVNRIKLAPLYEEIGRKYYMAGDSIRHMIKGSASYAKK